MTPPMEALRMTGDARALPAADGVDHSSGSEGPEWAGLGPVHANRDDTDPGMAMNPPMEALRMTGDVRTLPAADGVGHPFDSEGPEWAGLGPARANRDGTDPGAAMNPPMDALRMTGDARTLPAVDGIDHPFGSVGPGWSDLGPVRANRDGAGPGTAMNPPMDALRMTGDARALPAADGVDHPSDSEGLGWSDLGPVRANRDGADPGTRSPVAYDDDEPSVPAAPGEWRLAPIHATKDDDDPGAPGLGPARSERSLPAHTTDSCETAGNAGVSAHDLPGSAGYRPWLSAGNAHVSAHDLQPGVRGAGAGATVRGGIDWPHPLRADAGGEGERAPATRTSMVTGGTDWPHPLRVDAGEEGDRRIEDDPTVAIGGPLRIDIGGEGERAPATPPSIEPAPESAGDDPGRLVHRPAPPEPARTAVAGADPRERRSSRPSPERADVRESRSITHRVFDPRGLPRRHGAGRAIGVALSVLAAVGAGAAGGYHLWKTELVRPALVRGLPPMPAPIADLAPVQAANAATGEAAGPVTGTPLRPDGHPPVPAAGPVELPPASLAAGRSGPETREGSRRVLAVEAVTPEGAASPRAASITETSTSRSPEGSRSPGVVGAAGGPAAAMERSGAEFRPDAGPGIEIRKGVRDDHVAASLERAYEAFRTGDLESAAEAYRAVAGREPGNRDALLGLAAVATRAGRRGEAAGHYARVLASHPADAVARAALIAIEEPDPTRGEGRLKALLWSEPEAAHLHFDLGNVYAAQSRWPEAQQSYFDAYRFDRGNADYAHNLAVSLDHLSRHERALDFYREALALARSRPASFATAAVLARIRALDPSAGEDVTPVPPLPEPAGAVPAGRRR